MYIPTYSVYSPDAIVQRIKASLGYATITMPSAILNYVFFLAIGASLGYGLSLLSEGDAKDGALIFMFMNYLGIFALIYSTQYYILHKKYILPWKLLTNNNFWKICTTLSVICFLSYAMLYVIIQSFFAGGLEIVSKIFIINNYEDGIKKMTDIYHLSLYVAVISAFIMIVKLNNLIPNMIMGMSFKDSSKKSWNDTKYMFFVYWFSIGILLTPLKFLTEYMLKFSLNKSEITIVIIGYIVFVNIFMVFQINVLSAFMACLGKENITSTTPSNDNNII